jgi:hypothetical protein
VLALFGQKLHYFIFHLFSPFLTTFLKVSFFFLISDNLGLLADRLIGPFDIEAVVDPIGVKISDAIMNFQNSGYEVTSKVFEDCGRPRLQKRQVHTTIYIQSTLQLSQLLISRGKVGILDEMKGT